MVPVGIVVRGGRVPGGSQFGVLGRPPAARLAELLDAGAAGGGHEERPEAVMRRDLALVQGMEDAHATASAALVRSPVTAWATRHAAATWRR